MSKCPNCGMDNKPSAKFCRGCGTQLPVETPVEIQVNPTVRPAAPPAAKKTGKKSWMKVAIPALILIAAVALFKQAGGPKSSCPTCNEILDLQKQLQEVMKENEDNSLTFQDYDRWNTRVAALTSEIQSLKNHDCTMPVRKVKEQACTYDRYVGSYTGEWKSTAPCGEGIFTGTYWDGSTAFVCTYSGTWSNGVPNGTGAMVVHREYRAPDSQENWNSRFYEGSFVDGALTGSGWFCEESSSGIRMEYYGGVYRGGFPEGQANYLAYQDGELYDKGVAAPTGRDYSVIYSQRQEILDTLETAGALVVAGVAGAGLIKLLDAAIGSTESESFKNSGAGKWLEEQRAAIAADMQMWQENKVKEEDKKQRYDTWQALESQVKWCETSRHDDEREQADYYRAQADQARKDYEAVR